MKFKKLTAAVLAAAMFAGAPFAVARFQTVGIAADVGETEGDQNNAPSTDEGEEFSTEDRANEANGIEVHEESNYEISIDTTTVDGKDMVAVKLSNIPMEMLTHEFESDYTLRFESQQLTVEYRNMKLVWLAAIIDVGDKCLCFYTPRLFYYDIEIDTIIEMEKEFQCTIVVPEDEHDTAGNFIWKYIDSLNHNELPQINSAKFIDGETFSLEAYLEPNDDLLKELKTLTKTTVMTYAGLLGSGTYTYDTENPMYGDATVVLSIGSDGTVEDPKAYGGVYKERVNITNNLEETVPPTPSDVFTPATPVTPATPDDTTSSETSSEPTSSDTSNTTSSNTSETEETVTKVDEETGVTIEISKEDADLIDADFTVTPANHDTLLDLIKQIVDKIIDTITDQVRKALDQAADTVKNGNGFAYDISFRKNGAEVQPDKKVTVTVPVPDEFKPDIDRLNVYHLTDKGAVFVPSWIKDGAVMFETDSFSPYVITVEKLANAAGGELTSSAPDSSTLDTAPPDEINNPYTGGFVTLFAPIAALAAVTVAAVAKKKK